MLEYSCGQLTRRDELAASTDATAATQGSNAASTFGRRELLFIDALRHLGVHALAGEHPRTNVKERLTRLRRGAGHHRGDGRRDAMLVAMLVGWIDDPAVNSMGNLAAFPTC
ncbi:hypothetical protein IVB02_29650 [Bradyrhizobium sp. 166]|uniref:hypothetical protein n=1 Tax=Bradyrhizobium sp. 166 TaxID=2782638 RepID=UPI001FF7AEBE|nr:hypothetical protein [Bradyrhizobium sp. 166]MCK1605451.1 hypothetical protein [Bradyrhizobium sp. 166]